jgi:hypothetical protein
MLRCSTTEAYSVSEVTDTPLAVLAVPHQLGVKHLKAQFPLTLDIIDFKRFPVSSPAAQARMHAVHAMNGSTECMLKYNLYMPCRP